MSSVYGAELLKAPEYEDNVDEAIGKKNNYEKTGGEFETAHDRAKRIRKERREQGKKDKEDEKLSQMKGAINSLLSAKESQKAAAAAAAAPAAAGPSAGPSVGPAGPPGPSAGPSVGPSAGPSVGPSAGPSAGPSVGPAGPPAEAASSASAAGPAPRPRGPARPTAEQLPEKQETENEEKPGGLLPGQKVKSLGMMDILKDQKRVSWDELKANLANKSTAQPGAPGSKEFDDYSAKLEKERTERLGQQEGDTKRLLKQMNKGKGDKDKKKKKDKEKKKAKGSDQSDASFNDDENATLMKRYKQSA